MFDEIKALLEKMDVDQEVFTEDFTKQFALMVEAKVGEHKNELEESMEADNKAELETFKTEMVEKLDEYLNYFVEKYIEDNQEEIHSAVTISTAKNICEKFHGIVEDFNMQLDDTVVSDEYKMEDLEKQSNQAINRSIVLERENKKLKRSALVTEVAEDIEIESEKSSFTNLAEALEYTGNDESFLEKLEYVRDTIITKTTSEGDILEDAEQTENQSKKLEEADNSGTTDDKMSGYLAVLERTA
jgi:ribosomal protein L19